MDELKGFIRSQISIQDDDLQFVCSYFRHLSLERNRFLLAKGQIANSYYFVISGGLRIYFDHGDREITSWFAFQNEFFTELNSFKSGLPVQFNIQAIEKTELLLIDKDHMEILYKKIPSWQQLGRQVWENAFLKVVDAVLKYQIFTAEERYSQIIKQSELIEKVPLKQLASFLGITETSLSRLRKKIK